MIRIPALAGMIKLTNSCALRRLWIPALAGMMKLTNSCALRQLRIPALAGMTNCYGKHVPLHLFRIGKSETSAKLVNPAGNGIPALKLNPEAN